MSFWNQYGFNDPSTEMAGQLVIYHDLAMVVVVIVLTLVGWFLIVRLMSGAFFGGNLSRYIYKNEILETFWTVVPAIFLGGLGFVSLKNLYNIEVRGYVAHTVKVTGHQWYWEYQYELNLSKDVSKERYILYIKDLIYNWFRKENEENLLYKNFSDLYGLYNFDVINQDEYNFNQERYETFINSFINTCGESYEISEYVLPNIIELFLNGDWFVKYDSYIIPESELGLGGLREGVFRNQWVDNNCLLICNKKNEVLVSTADVIHRWGVSELGVKADAVPGRRNALEVEPLLPGTLFGNCYELCGEGHRQIPVVVTVRNYNNIIRLLKDYIFSSEYLDEFIIKMV